MARFGLALIALVFLAVVALFAQPEGDDYVIWRPITGAAGYRIQIRNPAGELVTDQRVVDPWHRVVAGYGNYEVRVAPLNAAGEVAVWSRWRPLRVIQVHEPGLDTSGGPVVVTRAGGRQQIAVRGSNFLPATRVRIENESNQIPVTGTSASEDGRRLTIEADLSNAPVGNYDLVVENPYERRRVERNFIVVRSSESAGTHFNDSLEEYRRYIASLARCGPYASPDPIVSDCHPGFATLNLRDPDGRTLYYFLKLEARNVYDRQRGYDYFSEHCVPAFRPARELVGQRLELNPRDYAPRERERMQRMLDMMANCRAPHSH